MSRMSKRDALPIIIRCAAAYKDHLAKKLSLDDFEIPADGTMELKLAVLPGLLSPNLGARMVGDYSGANPKLYTDKLAGNVKGCMGFIKPNRRYVPNTVLNVDIRELSRPCLRIIATYRKQRNDAQYGELVYRAKGVDLSNIQYPEGYEYLSSIQ